ncbi:hypothetical protein FIBSPDRAFT_876245 [Athelia psychrophila]|uniref:Uncharacterized protein n=1 Tax=Athelia psychrophila TaxID=1759441 RepID=A0A167X2B1_9AGAM|nr:hypothetical protein FIBSPDRAFT_876245 [Fibularhizoctonia sp. CBS 109695]
MGVAVCRVCRVAVDQDRNRRRYELSKRAAITAYNIHTVLVRRCYSDRNESSGWLRTMQVETPGARRLEAGGCRLEGPKCQ